MAHAIWTGSISFGLINIPINLYSAAKPESLKFHMLRKSDLSPINYVRVARADGKEVPYNEIVKGYEYRKGDYVVLTDEDFKKADAKKTQTIEIVDFVKADEIDSIFFNKPYYLEPGKGAGKPYALLAEALRRSGKVGIAKYVLRNKEHLGALRPHDNTLVLDELRFAEDIKPVTELSIPEAEKTDTRALNMAVKLIDEMTEHFNPEDFKDTYQQELMELIDEKADKGTITPRSEEPKATEFTNLMAELKKSLRQAQKRT